MMNTPREKNNNLRSDLIELYLQRINSAWEAINANKHHANGSFAKKFEEVINQDRLHPSALILQYAQSYLLVAIENLKHWCQLEKLYLENPHLGGLPILAPISNIRVSIENSATILWTLQDLRETENFQRVIQLAFEEISTFRNYLSLMHNELCKDSYSPSKINPLSHLNDSCRENFENSQIVFNSLNRFIEINGLSTTSFPRFTSGGDTKGLLFQLHGNQLEILYSQLSGTVHGRYWSFRQNTTHPPTSEHPTAANVTSNTFTVNEDLLGSALNVAVSLMVGATNEYLSLFN